MGEMLNFSPDRFGHLVFLDEGRKAQILARRIPAEFCITSNMLTSGLASATEHHVADWFLDPNRRTRLKPVT
jgi:adenosine deaminase